jgi:hypothetical protein
MTRLQDEFIQLSALRDDQHRKLRAGAPIDNAIDSGIRVEYEQLLTDLRKQMVKRQSMFGDIKRSVIDGVINKIHSAMGVILEVDPTGNHDDQTALAAKNRRVFAELEEENAELRRRVVKLRILKCLSEISTSRFFRKRMLAVEGDRKTAHAILWTNRLMYESQESALESQLDVSHRKLSDTEIEIEKFKQALETEKTSNGQLVQWKAKHLKTVDNLRAQLDAFKGVGDVNIAELLQKLSEGQSTLDALSEECEQFDEKTEEEVRKPMKETDGFRDDILETRREKAELMIALRKVEGGEVVAGLDIDRIRLDNLKLKRANQLLLEEITALENAKDKKGCDVRHFMESTVAPPPPSIRSSGKAVGTIIRPIVLPKAIFKL